MHVEQITFFSICSKNYMAQARCLFQSLREHHREAKLALILVDEESNPRDLADDHIEVFLAKEVVGPEFYNLAFQHSVTELNTAVKPFAIKYFLALGRQFVAYIDPDCYAYSRFNELLDDLSSGASIVLTPHNTQPIDDQHNPNDIDLLRAGTFNLGFVAVADTRDTSQFLDWWCTRLSKHCHFDPISGLFVDQKWVDLAPCFFDNVRLLKHPGYNVAYWNVFQRQLIRQGSVWMANGEPLRFFHFSGLPQHDVDTIARHQNRLTAENVGPFRHEFQAYLARLASCVTTSSTEPYSYALPYRGERIESQALRSAIRRAGGAEKITSLSDFMEGEALVQNLLEPHPAIPVSDPFPISRLLYDAWSNTRSIARAFPLFEGAQRARFLYWVMSGGYSDLEIHPSLLPWRELYRIVPNPLARHMRLTSFAWMIWLMEPMLRRECPALNDHGAARLVELLLKNVHEQKLSKAVLEPSYLAIPVVGEGEDAVSVTEYVVWSSRQDLRQAFDLETKQGRTGLKQWAQSGLAREAPWALAETGGAYAVHA